MPLELWTARADAAAAHARLLAYFSWLGEEKRAHHDYQLTRIHEKELNALIDAFSEASSMEISTRMMTVLPREIRDVVYQELAWQSPAFAQVNNGLQPQFDHPKSAVYSLRDAESGWQYDYPDLFFWFK
jgi:hypothetical protein